nr:DUF1015 domain-containing protein [Clostridia bacterium]
MTLSHNKLPFAPADILLPKTDHSKWAVIACDQFTSEPEYWSECESIVGSEPSALRIILPELYLEDDPDGRAANIRRAMEEYLASGIFTEYKNAMIYVERTLGDGRVRRGLVGAVDLEAYDYSKGAKSAIRATEGTVLERIPPRVKIRSGAPIESPHIMILIDDKERSVIEPLSGMKLEVVYDFDLMLGGGHLKGALLTAEAQESVLSALEVLSEKSEMLFAMGDGNHSLATAKTCYEADKAANSPSAALSRYALAEIVNIHDEALEFEPIYRVLFGTDEAEFIAEFEKVCVSDSAQKVGLITVSGTKTCCLNPTSALTVGSLQAFLDGYVRSHPGVKVDYIHGEDSVKKLVSDGNIGFIFDGMTKDELFPSVIADGALPRKTFSMGDARDKRYYMECRKVK